MTAVAPIRDYNGSQLALIRRTVAKDCDNTEFDLFMEMARRHGLDPFRKQIYAMVVSKDKPDKRQLVVVTGIDGYRVKAQRCRNYRPDEREPEYTFDESAKDDATNPLGLIKATVRAFQMDPNGNWHPVVASAYWEEFAPLKEIWEPNEQGKRQPTGRFELEKTSNWRRMPRVMLAKCAEAQALRKGWPEEFSGIYVSEEMDQAMVDVSPSDAAETAEADRRLALVHAKDCIPLQWSAGQPIEHIPVGQAGDRILEFISRSESPVEIEVWQRVNQNGLRQYWAVAKSEALEIKKKIEDRVHELEAAGNEEIQNLSAG